MPRRPVRSLALPLFAGLAVLAAACGQGADAGAARLDSHVFTNEQAGIAIELPALWAGRYDVKDTVTAPAEGLERELALYFRKNDSSDAEAPLLVVRIFSNAGWGTVNPDSAGAWWGTVIARDGARTVMAKPSPANPLKQGTADALGYDSLMMELLSRQMRASLRAPGR